MADHSKFLALSRKLIAREGRSVTFSKLVATSADAARPWKGAARNVGDPPPLTGGVTTIAVFLPDGAGFGKMIEDNELFKSSEQMLLVAPPESGEDLGAYDVVTDGSVRWKINIAKELKPADLTVLFAMGVSR
jgi:hypothetical protein